VATNQEIGNQLWAGETLDLNPGQQSGTLPLSYHASLLSYHAGNYTDADMISIPKIFTTKLIEKINYIGTGLLN
jgi:hypothetical protein